MEKDDRPDMKLLDLLRLPETRNIEDLDDPATTVLHGEIIRRKPFLRKLYRDFYRQFEKAVPEHKNKVIVEIGSGGGFLKEVITNATTSDVFELPDIDMVFSALEMPFEESSIDAILMLDVLHHLPDPRAFFKEAVRCLKPSGKDIDSSVFTYFSTQPGMLEKSSFSISSRRDCFCLGLSVSQNASKCLWP